MSRSVVLGRHIKSLRKARGMSQERLAEKSGLSADSIRRLEHGSFSPSLETLGKLCAGLDLLMSTLFDSLELAETNGCKTLVDLVASRSPQEVIFILGVVRAVINEMDRVGGARLPG
jgi:transcriptional regulator with XRE-family HTH domain